LHEIITCAGIDLMVRPNTVDRANALWMETSPFWAYFTASQFGPDATIMDLGAHVGSFTVAAAAARGCRVIAFEPEPESFKLIQSNAELNGQTERVSVHCAAVGGRTATLPLFESTETWGHTIIGTGGPFNALTGRTFTVRCFSLSDALIHAEVTHCDFLKFNIEGAEHDMFAVCEAATLRKIDRMVGEVHFDLGEAQKNSIESGLQSSGFEIYLERENEHRAYLYAWKRGLNGPPRPRRRWFWRF
jgi:FkbM family methyltransferase